MAFTQPSPGVTDPIQRNGTLGPAIHSAIDNYLVATGNQGGLISQLQATASGQGGPSLAEQQLVNATQRNAQANAATVASQRGLNPALAARQIQTTAAGLNQQEAGQAAENRTTEQHGAQSLLAQILGGQASTDQNLYGTASSNLNAENSGVLGQESLANSAHEEDAKTQEQLVAAGAQAAGTVAAAAAGGVGAPRPGTGSGGVSGVPTPPSPGFGGYGNAHGGDVPSASSFVDAYRTANQRDPVHAREMLLAFHLGKASKAAGGEVENMTEGGQVGGPPPVVAGDDKANDRTPIVASQGERVIPRTIAHDPEATARFIEELNRRERAKGAMSRSAAPLLARMRH